MISVNRLKPGDDLSLTILLLQRFFREEGFATPDEVIATNARRMVQLDTCAMIQAVADGNVIGVATVSMEFGIEFGWSAEMGDLYVLPEWRGKGVSRALVHAVEDVLREKGAAGYQVTVTPFAEEHHGLKHFYDRLGFEGEGRMILYRSLA